MSSAPWYLQKPQVHTQLHEVITKKDLPHLIKSEGEILIDSQYQQFLKIYTDGSKDPENNTNSCAFVIPELKVNKGYKLQSNLSIFMCELAAIFLALNWIQDFKPLNTVFFVDSLSALQAIKGSIYKVKNYIIYDIYNIITSLNNIGINVILEWIPSHVGILGNELADKEAKDALSIHDIVIFNPLYKEDIKLLCKSFLKNMWQKNGTTTHKQDIYTLLIKL